RDVGCAVRSGLAADVAACRLVILDLPPALAQGEQGQQSPELVRAGQVELAGGAAVKETAKRGLDHVIGIDTRAEARPQTRARQGDEPVRVAGEELGGGVGVSGEQAGAQGVKRVLGRHGWFPEEQSYARPPG